jgi:hypothetical protein
VQVKDDSPEFLVIKARDRAFFRDNPAKRKVRRTVVRRDLPPELRGFKITSYEIERSGPTYFIRRFLNCRNVPAFSGTDHYVDKLPTETLNSENGEVVNIPIVEDDYMDGDRAFFDDHPGVDERRRPMTASERADILKFQGHDVLQGATHVVQIAPGIRIRGFVIQEER